MLFSLTFPYFFFYVYCWRGVSSTSSSSTVQVVEGCSLAPPWVDVASARSWSALGFFMLALFKQQHAHHRHLLFNDVDRMDSYNSKLAHVRLTRMITNDSRMM